MPRFPGVLPAVLTPFDASGAIDEAKLVRHVEHLLHEGVHGLVTTGTMGEAGSMTRGERHRVTQVVVELAAGRAPVVAGVSAQTAQEVIAYGQDAAEAGADAVMVLPPLVYQADERELLAFYGAIAEAVAVPIMLYNNPAASGGTDLDAATIAVLAREIDAIVAVKECSGDARRIAALQSAGAEITIGGDDWALEGFAAGATGWVSGVANVAPRECVALFDLCAAGRLDDARRVYQSLLPLARLDMRAKLVQFFKEALRLLGRDVGTSRPPRLELDTSERDEVAVALKVLAAGAAAGVGSTEVTA